MGRLSAGWKIVVWVVATAVVLGAVTAVVVVTANRATKKSQATVCAVDAQTIRTAIQTDRAQYRTTDRPSMATLLERGYLVKPSRYHSVSYSGATLVLKGLGACAGSDGS
jgi:type II secretory pathway pseudopilin PulG